MLLDGVPLFAGETSDRIQIRIEWNETVGLQNLERYVAVFWVCSMVDWL